MKKPVLNDKNHFAGYYSNYGIIDDGLLPWDVRKEISNECPKSDSGSIVTPNHPLFRKWLRDYAMPVESYIVWWSWDHRLIRTQEEIIAFIKSVVVK